MVDTHLIKKNLIYCIFCFVHVVRFKIWEQLHQSGYTQNITYYIFYYRIYVRLKRIIKV